jgi:diguanylate cyclase (GGDEF)-like protein/PAS domain S-box-containing protein
LLILSRFGNGVRPLLCAGLLAGLGVVTMHYGGMAAMRMPGVSISYDPMIVAASVAIAIVAATAAFWLAFRTTKIWEHLAAAVVMGFAIAGMHYTGMAAAIFTMDGHSSAPHGAEIEPGILAVAVVSASSILLILGLVTAFFDRKLATMTAHEALALRRSEERLRALHRNASDIVAILDSAGTLTYEASSADHILGFSSVEMTGKPLAEFVPPDQLSDVRGFIGVLLGNSGTTATVELKMRHADGGWRDMEVFGKNLLHDPAIDGLVVNARDISERKRFMAELERLSETDSLTDTLNRRGFMRLAEREFDRARRNGQPLSLVMIDIDHFKAVNDSFGHAAGDMVLAMVADDCRRHIRSTDILSRFGGEEFLILLADAPLETTHEIVDRLHQGIAGGRVTTIKGEVSVTASFGIAMIDCRAVDLETAIRFADEALYEAKNSGRNCIKIRA